MSTVWSTESQLLILKESYRPPHAKSRIVDIPILSSTSSSWPYASILQHIGRDRRRASFTAHVSTWAYYEAVQTDYFNAEVRHFMGPDATTELVFMIEDLGEPQWMGPGNDDIRFTVTLVEAAT